jgi:hypothetical protein
LVARKGRAAFVDARRDHRFNKGRDDRASGRFVQRAIESNDAAKRGQRIRVAGAHIRVGDRGAGGDTTRVGVLDHRGGRLVELEDDAGGGIEIEEVRERQLLALQHGRSAETGGRIKRIPGGRLMGFSP